MERDDGVISLDGDENRLNLVKFGEIRFLGWQDRISVFHLLEFWSYHQGDDAIHPILIRF